MKITLKNFFIVGGMALTFIILAKIASRRFNVPYLSNVIESS